MTAYTDYKDGMKLVEEITEYMVRKVKGKTKIKYLDKDIDFRTPWKRISVREAIKKYAGIDIEKATDDELNDIIAKNNIKLKGEFSRGSAVMALIDEFCEKHFVQPTILYDYPAETSPLAKQKRDDPRYVERFEHYINCFEVGNHYSELNDPDILTENWKKQEAALKKGDIEAQRMDKDFIRALKVGMPPTCGIGIGVDRMVMLLTNQPSIRDVIFFPFMKPEEEGKK
jgi:lysyl-tRNA synthetase class 2